MNQLQALAMNEGYRWKKKLFSEQGRAQLEKRWEKQRKQRHGVTLTGGDGMCTSQCVDTRTLPRQQWPGNSLFVCT